MHHWQSFLHHGHSECPVFCNINLITPGSFWMLLTKFHDKFASLRQVNSPNSQDKFQICCTDKYMYLVHDCTISSEFRGILHGFVNLWDFADLLVQNLRPHNHTKYQKP